MNIDTLTKHISQWGEDRGITINGKPLGQAGKMIEEAAETLQAVIKGDKSEIIDGIGDVYVTLVMLAETSGLDIADCIEAAYEEIKDRKGFLDSNGVFHKEL